MRCLRAASPAGRCQFRPTITASLCRRASGLLASTDCAAMRARACRRQPNNCWGLIPFCRATSDTHEPGPRLSTMVRALSSSDHRRRRRVPVISSMRRTDATASSGPLPGSASFVLSVCSRVRSNRSLMARHQATARAGRKCGSSEPLTLGLPLTRSTNSCIPNAKRMAPRSYLTDRWRFLRSTGQREPASGTLS